MSSEKEIQLEDGCSDEQSTSRPTGRRSSLIATLGGILLLSTGFTAGMTTMYCNSQQRRSSTDFDAYGEVPTKSLHTRATTVWQPAPGLTWTYQLSVIPTATQLLNPKEFNVGTSIFSTRPQLQSRQFKQLARKSFATSVLALENWRPDAFKFKASDKGNAMEDWDGETWIDTRSANVRAIMAARLDLAATKAVTLSIRTIWMATIRTTHWLKNSLDIIPRVLPSVQFAVNEQCAAYNECPALKPFTDAGKAVFHVEYPKGDDVNNNKNVSTSKTNAACACKTKWNFSPIIKNSNLNSWIQKC